MRLLRHWKMILGLGALYGAGFVTGVVALVVFAGSHPNPDNLGYWANYRLNQYEKRLKLTPEQKVKIKPIVQNTRYEIQAIVRLSCEQAIPVLGEAHKKIDAELTPQQHVEFEKISREVLQRLRDFVQKEAAKAKETPRV